jgi:hypothetical protein
MAQIRFPEWQRKREIPLRIILANPKRTQGGAILRAIPALKENHSVAISLAQDNWLDTKLLDFRAKFMELGQDHFSIQCLHVRFRSFVKVDANKHKNLNSDTIFHLSNVSCNLD